ncbi:type I-E CRISPR-associated protein Cse1/CasA [Amycolatopsis coloradensis]|uniref:Type I-E CRISPR-associated protein Cse1/CasA n=1 Tax=Amycolatopsis coloradensis TaxID=76021 RepID=A0A1R0KU40_9PSEU|nr:type I-E CRISPR-associated protein Cse1/CasA [Amycolatopsis coloradensis]OLZ51643.1 type I-E CRISPR-associated protein Cse1/CasA [Amycolatopsis coloradensis]
MPTPSFSLISQPWIPISTDTAGPEHDASLSEVFARAHEIRLSGRSPQETAVLLRLLLAIYDAAAGPATDEEWDRAWQANTLAPDGRIAAYLERWSGRFDLLHPERPFAQCGHLIEYRRTPDVLDPLFLGGAAAGWFNHRMANPAVYPPHPPGQAARYLLILLGYDVAGIKGAPPGSAKDRTFGAKLGEVAASTLLLVDGRTLKDTLLLNLPPRPRASGDAPVWERDCPEPGVQVRVPAGRLDYLTWPSRRIRLRPDVDGHIDAVAWHDGDRVDGGYDASAPLDDTAAWAPKRSGGATPAQNLFNGFGRIPAPWNVARLLDPAHPSRSRALDHTLAAARRTTVDGDYPLRLWLTETQTNVHRSTLQDIRSGTVCLGPLRLHTEGSSPARALARTATATAALVWKIPRLAGELLPYVNQAAARITIDPGQADAAWWNLVDELSTLDADAAPEATTDPAQRFGATIFALLHTSATRTLPIAGRLDAAMEKERLRYLATLATHDEPPASAPSRGGGRRPSPPITIDGETRTLAQWATHPRCQVTKAAFRARINDGWPPADALITPARAPRPGT